jgi:hypothetical protein
MILTRVYQEISAKSEACSCSSQGRVLGISPFNAAIWYQSVLVQIICREGVSICLPNEGDWRTMLEDICDSNIRNTSTMVKIDTEKEVLLIQFINIHY